MKSRILMLIALLAVISGAQGTSEFSVLNVAEQCSLAAGVEQNDCRLKTSKIMPGFDLNLQNGATRFFFDSFFSIQVNGSSNPLPIRFVIWEDEKEYNAIQAIVQTAYATRTTLSIIFVNPHHETYVFSDDYVNTIRKTSKACYSAGGMFYCPIKSIQLDPN